MSIPAFGNIVPVHGHILALIGWRLSRGGSELVRFEPRRLEQMRTVAGLFDGAKKCTVRT